MNTLFKQPFPMLVATIVTAVALGACSNEMNSTDVSTGELQAVAVNFTKSSIGQAAAESPWQENDQVTVIPGGDPDGAITFGYIKQADESHAWQNIVEGGDNYFKAVLPASFTAFFPGTEGTGFNAFTLPNISGEGQTEKADQSDATKLRAADYMTTPITTVAQVDQALDLMLAHRLCRLTFVVTEYGNESNDVPTLENVKIKSQNRGVDLTYSDDQVEVNPKDDWAWVSPLATTNASDQPTYTAIVTPCTLISGKTELMSLTVNGTPLPVKYKGDLAELVSGSAYTFHLKVAKDYVTVTGSDVTGWTGTETDVTSKVVIYFTASDPKIGDYYYSDGKTSDGGLRKLYSDGTYQMEEGIMPNFLNDSRTVLGIVYWVGDATAKDKTLETDHPGCTHGLVVAIGGNEDVAWQNSYISVQEWLDTNKHGEFLSVQSGTGADAPLNNIQGYNNTKAIEAFNTDPANSSDPVTAVEKAVDYRSAVPAPSSSSGWYLPSAKELTLLCGTDVGDIWTTSLVGSANRKLINRQLSSIAGATQLSLSNYWSSSEYSNNRTFDVSFSNGKVNSYAKNGDPQRVQFTLAF